MFFSIDSIVSGLNHDMTCSLAWLAPGSQVPPDNFSYSACISALRGRWSMALALLAATRCSSLRINEVTYNAAITACGDRWQPMGEKNLEILRFRWIINDHYLGRTEELRITYCILLGPSDQL